nr:hypothetical protein [Breznakibacter sp.]
RLNIALYTEHKCKLPKQEHKTTTTICKTAEQICKYPKQENKTTKPIYKYTEQENKSTRNVRLIKFLKTIRDYGVKPREGVGGNPVKVAK